MTYSGEILPRGLVQVLAKLLFTVGVALWVASPPVSAQEQIQLLGTVSEKTGSTPMAGNPGKPGPVGPSTSSDKVKVTNQSSGISLVVNTWVAPSPRKRTVEATVTRAPDSPYEIVNAQFLLYAGYQGERQETSLGPLSRRFVYEPSGGDVMWPQVRARVSVRRTEGWIGKVNALLGVPVKDIVLNANLPARVFASTSTVRKSGWPPTPRGVSLHDRNLGSP